MAYTSSSLIHSIIMAWPPDVAEAFRAAHWMHRVELLDPEAVTERWPARTIASAPPAPEPDTQLDHFRELPASKQDRLRQMATDDERGQRLRLRPEWTDAEHERRAAYYAWHVPKWNRPAVGRD